MSRTSRAIGVVSAAVLAVGLTTGTAGAQNLDVSQLAAAVALPIVTGGQPPNTLVGPTQGDLIFADDSAITLLTITNGRTTGSTVLRIDAISGDPAGPVGGDNWTSNSFECLLTPRETVTFLIRPVLGQSASILTGECSTALGADFPDNILQGLLAQNGVFFAAAANPAFPLNTSPVVGEDVLFADAIVVDLSLGQAVSFPAIGFQAGTGANDQNKIYKFDGQEYSTFPRTLATNFIMPDQVTPSRINAELILFTLDGTLGSPPRVLIFGEGYDDDENGFDWQHTFDCFDIVSLTDLSFQFTQQFSGSLSGHLSFNSVAVGSGLANDVHDAEFGNGNGSRNRGVHGWIVQNVLQGADLLLPGQPTDDQNNLVPPGGNGMPGYAAWGRPLAQSGFPLAPEGTDQDPTLKAGP